MLGPNCPALGSVSSQWAVFLYCSFPLFFSSNRSSLILYCAVQRSLHYSDSKGRRRFCADITLLLKTSSGVICLFCNFTISNSINQSEGRHAVVSSVWTGTNVVGYNKSWGARVFLTNGRLWEITHHHVIQVLSKTQMPGLRYLD